MCSWIAVKSVTEKNGINEVWKVIINGDHSWIILTPMFISLGVSVHTVQLQKS